ncbi:MAG TPA: hypothetical protein VK843_06785 [Planctomycetota bacterium]|nr:hypothetical protein [Planctomycetota bacterium]
MHTIASTIAALTLICAQDPVKPPEPLSMAATDDRIVHFVVDPKETALYTLSAKNTVACWSLTKKAELWHESGEKFPDMALSLGTKFVYIGGKIPSLRSREVETGKQGPAVGVGGPGAMPLVYAADPKDRWVWVGLDNGSLERVVPANIQTFSHRGLKNGGASALAIDPEGNLLAVGGVDKTIRFVGASSANVDDKKIFEGLPDSVTALVFAGKSTLLSGTKDGGLRLWTVASGKVRFELAGHSAAVRALVSSPKGDRAASADDTGKVFVWDLGSGKSITSFQGKGAISALAFLDKGKSLAANDGGSGITVWKLPEQ